MKFLREKNLQVSELDCWEDWSRNSGIKADQYFGHFIFMRELRKVIQHGFVDFGGLSSCVCTDGRKQKH